MTYALYIRREKSLYTIYIFRSTLSRLSKILQFHVTALASTTLKFKKNSSS